MYTQRRFPFKSVLIWTKREIDKNPEKIPAPFENVNNVEM